MIAFSQSSKIMIRNSNHFGFFFVVRKMSIFVGNTIDRAHKHSLPLAAQKKTAIKTYTNCSFFGELLILEISEILYVP